MELTAFDVSTAINDKYGFNDWEFYDRLEESQGERRFSLPGIPDAAVWVDTDTTRNVDSYGYDVGGEVILTFKIGDQYFRKHGYSSSYGGMTFDGALYEATMEEVPVVVKKWKRV